MTRISICHCAAVMFFALSCQAADKRGATQQEIAYAVKWASEEPDYSAKRFLPGVDYPAIVRRCLARDAKSFRTLFALSVHTDAAASDLQAGILAIVLKHVGDDFFVTQLMKAPKATRIENLELLKYELLDRAPQPYRMTLGDYPKIKRLLNDLTNR